MGRCPDCEKWDTLIEQVAEKNRYAGKTDSFSMIRNEPIPMNSIQLEDENRMLTGINEFDRVLGGGLVYGSLVLIGGDPGIGTSTLMLQALNGLALAKHIYVDSKGSYYEIDDGLPCFEGYDTPLET